MKKFTLLFASMLFFVINIAKAQVQTPSEKGTLTYLGETQTLKTLMPFPYEKSDDLERNEDLKERKYPFAASALPKGEDPAWQKKMGETDMGKGAAINFEGMQDTGFPPDPNGDVGPDHYVQTVNSRYQIFDKTGNSLYGPADIRNIWGTTKGVSDPVVLYDENVDRWFISIFSTTPSGGPYDLYMAVSTSPDPSGTYHIYTLGGFSSKPDFTKFGVWRDGYYMSANRGGNDVYVFERDQMLIGGGVHYFAFDNSWRPNSGFHCIMPLDNDGQYAPSGTPGMFITINDDAWGGSDEIWLYELDVDWVALTATFNRTQQLSVASFDSNFGSSWDNISQQGTSQKLDAVPQVLNFRAQYRNLGSYQSIVCNHSVDVDNTDHAGIRWYEVVNTGSTWWMYQQSTFAPDSHSRWMGAININAAGDIGLAYSISSTSMHPSLRFTGRKFGDALNTMTIAEQSILESSYSQTSGNRWGDYYSMSVDPSDGETFWFTGEYRGSNIRTRISAFSFNSYCAASGGTNPGSSDEYISRIQFGEIDNQTDADHYTNYSTTLVNEIPVNAFEEITVTNGHPWSADQCGIWVDWNNDDDFDDAGEAITVNGNPGNGPYTATIAPPASASVGDEVTMRVRIVYNATPLPCNNTTFGEVEDYSIKLTSKVSNEWTGTINNQWHNNGNWALGHYPTYDEDVTIPNVSTKCWIADSDAECHNLTVEAGSGNYLRVYDETLHIYGNLTINAQLKMDNSIGVLDVDGNVVWNSGSTANFTANTVFWVGGNWNFNSGANAQLANGTVDFNGTGTSWIRSYDSDCSFNTIGLYKTGTNWTRVSDLSTEDLTINGSINMQPSANFGVSSDYNVILKGNLNNHGTFDFTGGSNTGTFVFDGTTQSINMYTANGTFNNVKFSSSSSTSVNQTGDIEVKGNLTIESGNFDPNDHQVTVGGNWTNSVGTSGFVEGAGRVVFNGTTTGVQFINSTEHFYELENASVGGIRPGGGTDVSCEIYYTSGGGISTVGSTFTAFDLAADNISDNLYAHPNSSITLHQTAGYVDLYSSVVWVKDNASINIIGGADKSYWCTSTDLELLIEGSGVFNFDGPGITIYNTYMLNETITNGSIKTSGWFTCNRTDFNPAGGTFEFYGGSDSRINVLAGSTFHDLLINKSGGDKSVVQYKDRDGKLIESTKSNTALLYSDVVVDNNLTITDGALTLNGHELTVLNNSYFYGTLNMTNAADVFNSGVSSGDQFWFYNGSTGNISAGNIYLAWGIVIDNGASFTATTANTIHYNSGVWRGGIANDDPNTVFGNIDVNKSAGYFQIWTDGNEPIIVDGDFTLAANQFEMNNLSMVIHGNFTDQSASETYLYNALSKSVKGGDNDSSGTKNEDNNKGDVKKGGKAKGGYLEIDTDFTLNGLLDIDDGDVLVHGVFGTATTGSVVINGGTFIADAPNHAKGWEYLNGNLSMTTGLFEITNNSINFSSTATTSISDGTLRTGGAFHATDAGVFQPTGGTVEVIGSSTSDNAIYCSGNNYFYDLLINRDAGLYAYLANETTIQNDLTINNGIFNSYYNYNINIGGNWTNNVGVAGFEEGSTTVIFNGTGDVSISPDETFYNLTLDKVSSSDWLTPMGNLIIGNDLVVNPGALYSGANTISVSGNVTVNAGGVLYMQANSTLALEDASNLNVTGYLYVVGNAGNYATITHQSTGFYSFNINSGGDIGAQYAIFEYMNGNGIYLQQGSNLHPSFTFNNCIFRRGHAAPSTLLALSNDDIFTCTGAYFENTFGTTGWNVWKYLNTGDATFVDASGDFAGPEYELDNWDNIHWTDIDVELDLTVMLEGSYNGAGMNTDLYTLGLIPNNQPFDSNTGADWYYTGTEYAGSIPANVVDWVLVKIKDASDAASSASAPVVAEQAAFLLNNGSIVDLNGSSNLSFTGISYSSGLFPVVWHRNHLGIISADKMTRIGGVYTYDFTQAGAAYTNSNPGETNLGGGVWGMYGGDSNGSGWVYDGDTYWDWNPYAGETGYRKADFNLDGQLDNKDKNDVWVDSYNMQSQIPGSKGDYSNDME